MTRGPRKTPQTSAATPVGEGRTPSLGTVVAALAGMGAAWLGAGSTGLLAHDLAHALMGLALGVAIVASWPGWQRAWQARLVLTPALLATALATAYGTTTVYGVLCVASVLAILAWGHGEPDRRLLLIVASAALALGIYALARTSIPAVWLVADALGRGLGRAAGWLGGRSLSVGATFSGLDFLVVMGAVYAGWLVSTPAPRLGRAVTAAVAIVGAHGLYLVLLAHATALRDALPPAPVPEMPDRLYVPPPWSWSDAARSLLPWNVPLVAGVLQLAVAAAMFRWSPCRPVREGSSQPRRAELGEGTSQRARPETATWDWRRPSALWGPAVLAALIPVIVVFSPGDADLNGARIVAYERGFLDWNRPVHDGYGEASAGLYGMLPDFVGALGGRFRRSADLAESDLAEADVLMLIHPTGEWPADRLERVRGFVERGGSLLLLAESMFPDDGLGATLNAVLQGTGLRLRFDTAVPAVGDWQHGYTVTSHPAVLGIGDRRNRFGLLWGPSIDVRRPARPILAGRWGWSDPGVDAVLTGAYRIDEGERLGDLVLAAEQRVGRGTIVVVSDTSSFTNLGTANAYVFAGRLLAYLAGRAASPQAAWRQVLGLFACVFTMVWAAWRFLPERIAVAAALVLVMLAGARTLSHASMRVLPGPSRSATSPGKIAYIDASHLEAYNQSGWGYAGIAGLELTLMRNGYVPFLLPKITHERLERAELLISIAPSRPFSSAERAVVRRFVERGGTFLCTVGAERARVVEPLLGEFGIRVPYCPVPPGVDDREPDPMGHFTTPYLRDDDYQASVMFYEGWPVECAKVDALVYGFDDLPVIARRRVGQGTVIVIGDPSFAMNRNLEYIGGEPFGGRYQNAHFWRWLLSTLRDGQPWRPPNERGTPSEASPVDDERSEPAAEEPTRRSPFDDLPVEEVLP